MFHYNRMCQAAEGWSRADSEEERKERKILSFSVKFFEGEINIV